MKLLIFITLFLPSVLMAQNKVIEVKEEAKGNKLFLFCENNASSTQEVTLTLSKLKGIKGYSKPIKKTVAANTKELFAKLTIKGEYSYAYSTRNKSVMTKADIAKKEEKLKNYQYKKGTNINEGIVVFSRNGCVRCNKTTSYLLDNNIDFKYINISDKKNSKKKQIMLSKLMESGFLGGNLIFPVVMIDGVISYSHANLKEFLSGLNSN